MHIVEGNGPEGPRRLLVTGATGFIGGKLVAAALQAGYEPRVLVRKASRANVPAGAEIHEGDLLIPETLAGIEREIDSVVHCAGLLGSWPVSEARLHAVNVQGSLNLLHRFQDSALHSFVHLSAGGVTGPLQGGVVDERYSCRPATAYERTKLLAEERLLEGSRRLQIALTVVRPTFTYGPGDPHKLALLRAVKQGRYAFIGDGKSLLHPVFVDDLVSGILLALLRARSGETYIIGGARPVTKLELVHTIADLLKVKHPSIKVPRWIAALAAPGLELLGRACGFEPILTRSRVMMMADNFGYSIDKARSELGYEPRVDLREGLDRTIRYYKDNKLL